MQACRQAGKQEPCTSRHRMDSLGLQSLKLECAQPLSLGATPSGPHYLLASKQTILLLLLFLLLLLLQLLPWICVVGMVLLLPPQDLLRTPSEKGKYAVHAPTIHALAHLLAFTHTKGGPTRQTQIAGLPLSALAATRTQRQKSESCQRVSCLRVRTIRVEPRATASEHPFLSPFAVGPRPQSLRLGGGGHPHLKGSPTSPQTPSPQLAQAHPKAHPMRKTQTVSRLLTCC